MRELLRRLLASEPTRTLLNADTAVVILTKAEHDEAKQTVREARELLTVCNALIRHVSRAHACAACAMIVNEHIVLSERP